MVTVRYPSLTLSANSTAVLLDTVKTGFRVYSLPALNLQLNQDSYENVFQVILSSSGTAVGIWTTTNELKVMTAESGQSYRLPHPQGQIRDLALSDGGDKLALLVAFEAATLKEQTRDNGALEIWSLPIKDKLVAALKMPVLEWGELAANGALSKFFVHSRMSVGNSQITALYKNDGAALLPIWSSSDPEREPADAALYGEWVWLAQAESLEGWQGTDSPAQLPGTLRDRMRFSPAGDHLLAYRVEKNLSVTSAEMLFRLFDLATLTEVRRVTHTVEQPTEAHFALSPELSLLEVRATREAEVMVKELGW